MRDIREAQYVGRTSDGRLVQRPMSGHLSVFFNFDMVMSVSHRVTGCAIAVGTIIMVWFLVAAASGEAAYATFSRVARSPIGYLALFGWTFALWYHWCVGIRHLIWDAGKMYDLPSVERSRAVILGASAGLTLLTWFIALT
ncbi:Succinate dehydrogenase cytochrome b-556 subunit [Rhodovastum atsumiense]|uniref:Succinate dehydrogenase cytochrome b556 subunit n=1 Tax=Rhodovastum atsumiense TaxID=504468 RepID=A0A5M6IWF3_9PROT|nr:succinate dehydrogenase, cytochrome b556 subunit [Rhodovastum atsumiense]KAA5612299.1 succinate dehydrogenase, cytochrome b556 subunit [Rhodovastum atsumiense]CAH2601629.1 Succinate dehydrogenase cytochrome b-556 subunit [Rhodovastum atsumiense]